MGKMEMQARSTRRKGYLQHAVLSAVAVSGMLLVMAAAPNTLQLLGAFGNKKRFRERTMSAIGRLASNGLVVFEKSDGGNVIRITDKGRRYLAFEEQRMMTEMPGKRRWDKRYRIVMFDIREKRKATRNALSATMRSWGFLRLQDSVWVYPYDCEDLIALLKTDLRIGKEVIYVIADTIENDGWVRTHFHLPRG
ncbi:hypothetical protein HZC00_05655 [Candidatus Kaiserbacteria bacterium]|nr:hypothetical protein [Candidatus Kaiserbacteria bacterium]